MSFSRRRLIKLGSGFLMVGASPMVLSATVQSASNARELLMDHTHTHEQLDVIYAVGSRYVPQALNHLQHFLRDHYSGDIGPMDPALYDLMHRVRSSLKVRAPFQIISAYRSPATNQRLRERGGGGVARHSLHMQGQAIDLRIPGVPLNELRDAAMALSAGGVGYYPGSQFVHIDTGRVRHWAG
jgi:uncharacterized protein YcbK (DUF882 family)